MFLDFINENDKKRNVRTNDGHRLIRRPQMIVLIGDFDREETACFQRNMESHFPDKSGIFWVNVLSEQAEEASFFKTWPSRADARMEYADYAKKMEEDASADFTETLAAEVYNATSGMIFKESGIMLSLLAKPDQPQAGCLEKLAKMLKKSLQNMFSSVYADLYLVLDQRAYTQGRVQREAAVCQTMTTAESLVQDNTVRMGYVFSNLDSKDRLLEEVQAREEQYASIALLFTLKDLIPDNTTHIYSDDMFARAVVAEAEARGSEPGMLSSAGHINLHIDETYNRLAAYRTVWERLVKEPGEEKIEEWEESLGAREDQIRQHFQPPTRAFSMLTLIDFEAIVRDHGIQEQSVYTMKNGDAVERIFGNNLDLYYQLNQPQDHSDQKLNDWVDTLKRRIDRLSDEVSCFDIAILFERLEQTIQGLIDDAKEKEQHKRDKLEDWEKVNVASKKGVGHSATPLLELAAEYLKRLAELEIFARQQKVYDKILKKVSSMGMSYQSFRKLARENAAQIDSALKRRYDMAIRRAEGLGKLQLTNADSYYSEMALKLIGGDNLRAYRDLNHKLRQLINQGVFLKEEEINRSVAAFCEEHIFSDQVFHMSFLEELENRLMGYQEKGGIVIATPTDVSNFLLTTIVDARHYLFRDYLYSGYQAHEEMCLFMNNDSIFSGKRDTNSIMANIISDQKMRLFCDEGCSSLDVLFLAGNLKANSIHKWSNYAESYQKLSERVENDSQLSD